MESMQRLSTVTDQKAMGVSKSDVWLDKADVGGTISARTRFRHPVDDLRTILRRVHGGKHVNSGEMDASRKAYPTTNC